MIGQIIGNYKIEAKLGEGGMGAVYRGVDTMLDREVAIKALKPELASQTSVVERFRTEAVTLAKLNHPNVATLYTMFRQGDELYMVLEFVRGETLDNILQRRGALPAEEAIPVFCQVLDGIDHAHELGIVHRDIKPANMMLTEKGTLKVLDFGIARLLGSARMTRAGNIIGTLEYMAPEQVRGLETDGRSDLYALGMMLYEVLTGKLPFDTDNEFELMKAQTELTPAPPSTINPNIPPAVEAAIMKAIDKDPNKRFQTGGEFREVLMNAGFAASGTMHGMTGMHARPATAPSNPPVDLSEMKTIVDPVRPSLSGIKETRLGAPVATAVAPAQSGLKATRLSSNHEVAAPPVASVPQVAPQQGSFFSRLTAVHYAGAGLLLLLLIGGVIAIPVVLMMGSSSKVAANTNTAETKKDTQKPDVITMPAQPVTQPTLAPTPASSSNSAGAESGVAGDLTPVTGAPAKGDKTAPPQRQAPPPAKAPAPAKPKGDSKSRAEKLLTGN